MARRRRGLPIDGVLLLDKPPGVSSNHALQRARRLFQAQKAGHTGTLDPMATGLLPVCFGEATKFSSYLLEADKVYRTRVKLGEITDTGDADGSIVERRPVAGIDEATLQRVLNDFRGEIEQIPPMHSALKHQGRPLYELAREGKTIARAPRRVTVYDTRLVSCTTESFELEVACSKGTYIRTLAEDIGSALGCGAHITALRRLKTGPFQATDMVGFEGLEAESGETLTASLLPMDVLVRHLPRLDVEPEAASRLLHGQRAAADTAGLADADLARLYRDGAFLGLVAVTGTGEIAPRRLIATG
ncbi:MULTISPECIES: tRNA pseudouridine(55) synthase TruB [Modicisalibacter]|uniref:tRNA pseudouridine(55) synthase TruB n=1 Tax=Modicisalibacter TaxID=574347 RepID=UPI00100A3BDE|nr:MULTISPECIES: tRNA pseudouridine(55) synthase TruB [Halomonadaceae]MBZ9558275.1 tRNA pseudouridine(55) synthase TruB [Modicisalibacter sp. R2A 31.J]MBZ9577382.1 tRNA pseudouridine(55) synthase TruB [Modicisalibacter sp. MOD 31.J]